MLCQPKRDQELSKHQDQMIDWKMQLTEEKKQLETDVVTMKSHLSF